MPRRSRATGRPNGRPPGSKNKATIEREERARRELEARERELEDGVERIRSARREGRKLAREALDDLMHMGLGLTAAFQRGAGLTPEQMRESAAENRGTVQINAEWEERFWKAAEFTQQCASALVNFQSPKLKAEVRMEANPQQPPAVPLLPGPAPGSTNVQYFLEHTYRRMLKQVVG